MTEKDKVAAAVKHFLELSEESFASAERELEAGAYHTSINRIYYTAFYVVTAALLERGRDFVKHSGILCGHSRIA